MLVESLGGSICVKSKVGKGSTFTVRLLANRVNEIKLEKKVKELTDNRLIQAIAIEFSDLYL